MRNFREYDIWQKAVALAVDYYKLTERFPSEQKFVLVAQIQRAAVSISSNIAEGCSRPSEAEFARFLEIAIGSCFEVESQLILSEKLGFLTAQEMEYALSGTTQLQKQISTLISKIRQKSKSQTKH